MGHNTNRANKRSSHVTLSLSPSEYEELEAKAAEKGLKPATVARRLLLEHIRFFAQ